MNANELRELQAPLKNQYREDPNSAMVTLRASSEVGEGLTCKIETGKAIVEAGLHPATGGDGLSACSGDMLLEALVACAGVTLKAVAVAIAVNIESATVTAEGDLDFRGTLAVDREAPVGFKAIRLIFDVESDANEEQLESLFKLTERYCVVYQSLVNTPQIVVSHSVTKK